MTEQLILHQLFLMPETLKQEVLHYITYLSDNYNKQISDVSYHNMQISSSKKPKFGSAKDKYSLSPDFDAPIDDFNEYMQ